MHDPLFIRLIGLWNNIPAEKTIKRIAAVLQNSVIRILMPAQRTQCGGDFNAV